MAGGVEGKKRSGRSYRPAVEAMEALRLLSGATAAASLPGVAAEHGVLSDPPAGLAPLGRDVPAVSGDAWDEALIQTQLADLLGRGTTADAAARAATSGTAAVDGSSSEAATPDPAAVSSGLSQLDRYLNRTWYRAAIPVHQQDDCTQAVYATLLQQVGRARFEALLGDVGHSGIKDVFTRETNDGLAFFRAVDMVKKRAQRERSYVSIDAVDVASPASGPDAHAWRDALREAIDQSLSPKEASLIHETLMGKTPAEIAQAWGVAPKTISNEKTRVIQKLRQALLVEAVD
ncbi:Bacterial regulatory protein, luxR family [Aquisphaera giovannonii]|uniref:Bacterial regulatory protein, luxR family n=1 Tax=Aquisphaera giovannonii TaxID=406548 RepID=A0A5B9WD95_9BACT|nr:sigma-70 family RNA polymerase sigma factor [Aquisphaera giovannonii]QEH38035.1 Bacterial regulatory protein, luxR family [Aquisphaera giovannonii]